MSETVDTNMLELRKRSGGVESQDPLVSFLYELMRDHVPPGTVETIMKNTPLVPTKFCNGWLAKYAEDVASRLRKADAPGLEINTAVTINGQRYETVPRAFIGYSMILALAGLDELRTYSMTYRGKSAGYGDSEITGVLAPGQEVRLLKDMVINVAHTGNA